ncbi:uncharacterized protein J8A68_001408 [[Candida] subhashii]|uniref:Uncharacterized protein n=1 Tax=[Candida] subhashii TaxID=561895 RepID=A0A8J5QG74_9ASCO|nr:uncharacterized protein J8A68_001408 [[Candida] subhashii]KAG7665099.1 hypothetical protein J8A68_001408 [[Candida] subhashii]
MNFIVSILLLSSNTILPISASNYSLIVNSTDPSQSPSPFHILDTCINEEPPIKDDTMTGLDYSTGDETEYSGQDSNIELEDYSSDDNDDDEHDEYINRYEYEGYSDEDDIVFDPPRSQSDTSGSDEDDDSKRYAGGGGGNYREQEDGSGSSSSGEESDNEKKTDSFYDVIFGYFRQNPTTGEPSHTLGNYSMGFNKSTSDHITTKSNDFNNLSNDSEYNVEEFEDFDYSSGEEQGNARTRKGMEQANFPIYGLNSTENQNVTNMAGFLGNFSISFSSTLSKTASVLEITSQASIEKKNKFKYNFENDGHFRIGAPKKSTSKSSTTEVKSLVRSSEISSTSTTATSADTSETYESKSSTTTFPTEDISKSASSLISSSSTQESTSSNIPQKTKKKSKNVTLKKTTVTVISTSYATSITSIIQPLTSELEKEIDSDTEDEQPVPPQEAPSTTEEQTLIETTENTTKSQSFIPMSTRTIVPNSKIFSKGMTNTLKTVDIGLLITRQIDSQKTSEPGDQTATQGFQLTNIFTGVILPDRQFVFRSLTSLVQTSLVLTFLVVVTLVVILV